MHRLQFFSLIFLLALMGAVPLSAQENIEPFSATYSAEYNGMSITATRSLSLQENGDYLLEFKARSWMAKIDEYSRFSVDGCGQINPREYNFQQRVLGSKRFIEQTFNWIENTVTSKTHKKTKSLEITNGVLDRLSYQLQLQWDLAQGQKVFNYPFADKTRIKSYEFEARETETLKTELGALRTIRVDRTDDENKTLSLWFAPDKNHLLVKLQEKENGKINHEINITSAVLGQQSVATTTSAPQEL